MKSKINKSGIIKRLTNKAALIPVIALALYGAGCTQSNPAVTDSPAANVSTANAARNRDRNGSFSAKGFAA